MYDRCDVKFVRKVAAGALWRRACAALTLSLLVALTPTVYGANAAPADATAPDLTVLVFGDSISAAYGIRRDTGWVALLERRLREIEPDSRVVNASVSGETTQGGRTRLPQALRNHNPDLVFIELGGNDALRGYPVPRIEANLRAMIEASESAGARVVLLGMQIPPNYGPRYTRDFAAAFERAARGTQAARVPFFLDGVALIPGMLQDDGIHPTAVAQPRLLDNAWQALVECLKTDYPALAGAVRPVSVPNPAQSAQRTPGS